MEQEKEKETIIRCTFRQNVCGICRGYHDIDKNSECAKEERYTITSTHVESSQYISSGGRIGSRQIEIIKVYCFDCLIKEYCQRENCTNGTGTCKICESKQDICSECMEKDTGYARCCKDCAPCKTCLTIYPKYPQDPDHDQEQCQLRECSSCQELVCREDVHKILDCNNCEAPNIHELKDYLVLLRDQFLELKLHLLKVENVAHHGKQAGDYAERVVEQLENKLDSFPSRYSSSY